MPAFARESPRLPNRLQSISVDETDSCISDDTSRCSEDENARPARCAHRCHRPLARGSIRTFALSHLTGGELPFFRRFLDRSGRAEPIDVRQARAWMRASLPHQNTLRKRRAPILHRASCARRSIAEIHPCRKRKRHCELHCPAQVLAARRGPTAPRVAGSTSARCTCAVTHGSMPCFCTSSRNETRARQ